jgi:hypothetical protein
MMRTIWGIAVVCGLVLQAQAESVRSNQKDYGNQSTTVTSNAHGAPAKVVPPPRTFFRQSGGDCFATGQPAAGTRWAPPMNLLKKEAPRVVASLKRYKGEIVER